MRFILTKGEEGRPQGGAHLRLCLEGGAERGGGRADVRRAGLLRHHRHRHHGAGAGPRRTGWQTKVVHLEVKTHFICEG